jgi:hypothetical protein
MKYLLLPLLSAMLSMSTVKAQYKFVTHYMRWDSTHPAWPYWDGNYVWWDDSTVSYVPTIYHGDTAIAFKNQIDFLMRDDLETHRRLDSLIVSIRQRFLDLK